MTAARILVASALLALAACGSSHDATDRALARVAGAAGADDGQVVFRQLRSGGVFDQARSLVVVTLRRGDRAQVLQHQLDGLTSAGYRPGPASGCLEHPDQQCTFTDPATLPHASLAAAGAGTPLFYEDGSTTRVVDVPAGYTGVRLVLSFENPPADTGH